jgi:hypothetical protein
VLMQMQSTQVSEVAMMKEQQTAQVEEDHFSQQKPSRRKPQSVWMVK